jgi:hypothetical protein
VEASRGRRREVFPLSPATSAWGEGRGAGPCSGVCGCPSP